MFQLKDGRQFFMFDTAHGDGEYNDQFGNSYGVDSGRIGAIREEDIRFVNYSKETIKRLGCFHTFEDPLTSDDCSCRDGLICIGHLEIDTDPSYEEEEEPEWAHNDWLYMEEMERQNSWLEEGESDSE